MHVYNITIILKLYAWNIVIDSQTGLCALPLNSTHSNVCTVNVFMIKTILLNVILSFYPSVCVWSSFISILFIVACLSWRSDLFIYDFLRSVRSHLRSWFSLVEILFWRDLTYFRSFEIKINRNLFVFQVQRELNLFNDYWKNVSTATSKCSETTKSIEIRSNYSIQMGNVRNVNGW